MDQLLALLQPLRRSVGSVGDAILDLSNPALPKSLRDRAIGGLPFIEFELALLITLGYLLLVLVGYLKMPKAVAGAEKEGKAVAQKETKTVAQKFQDEPILYLQFVYNWAQVALCGYMMVTAASVAMQRGYSLLCNKFDPSLPLKGDRELLNVLWVFYASKVRRWNLPCCAVCVCVCVCVCVLCL